MKNSLELRLYRPSIVKVKIESNDKAFVLTQLHRIQSNVYRIVKT